MKRACIAIVDSATARLFTYQHDEPQELIEEKDLISSGRAKDGDLFTDSPSSRGVGARGTAARGGIDDHRDAHRDDMDAKFAAHVAGEVERLAKEKGLARVVIVTPPRMLGTVRPHLETMRKHGLVVDELARDLANMTVPQMHDHLASLHVIEPRRREVMPPRR